MAESLIPDTKINIEDVINSLPDCWKNTPRIMNPFRAKLNNGVVSMLVDIDENVILFMVFVSEKSFNRSESIELSKEEFYLCGASEIIKNLTPLVDEWNKAMCEKEDKHVTARNVFIDIVSAAKISGMAVIPAMTDNSFHFKNGDDKHHGEITEIIEGNYRLVLNKLSDSEVKKILALVADIK
ncbi:hypothetical protein MPI44_004603 [Klebsiella oxytoca]|nr:hypothetical protein [Klebsiella oxytoca]